MRIAVTGSTGLVGSALVSELRSAGHSVSRVVRSASSSYGSERRIAWNPDRDMIDQSGLEGHEVIVHLAGERIFGRWTAAKKRAIRESRVRGTTLLARTIARLRNPPRVLISASAVGYYGNRPPSESLDEQAAKGTGFLSDVVAQWEEAAQPAGSAGVRVVHPRFGLVMSPRGGALGVMLPIFQLGIGGKLGSGDQIWSWIALADVIGAISHVIGHEELTGPVNFSAPDAVSNAEFTRALGRVLNRPTIFAVPEVALRLVMREMANELLLGGARVVPRKLLESGYRFLHPELEPALHAFVARR